MFYMPFSPRWLMEKGRDEEALQTVSRLRRKPINEPSVQFEYLEIKAEVMFMIKNQIVQDAASFGNFRQLFKQYIALVATWPKFRRLAIGCLVMFYQQFMVRMIRSSLHDKLIIFRAVTWVDDEFEIYVCSY